MGAVTPEQQAAAHDQSFVAAISVMARYSLPCFAMEPRPIPPTPGGVEFRLDSADDWRPFVQVTADGFGMPAKLVNELYAPAMLDHAGVRGYLGIADGQPVACGMSIRTVATLGIYSIATVPEARGKGYGTAVTWELMRDAEPGWNVAVRPATWAGQSTSGWDSGSSASSSS
jgi:ribosomal protein S18 acetylase RimI-like enzyme